MLNLKTEKLTGIKQIYDKYDVYFVDLWGVMHDGITCYENAIQVLKNLKKYKKKIILISNAPRPNTTVKLFLEKIGLKSFLYDHLITSGDVTREYINLHLKKNKIYHLGPEKDKDLFYNLKIHFTSKEECEVIICTGLFDAENEDVEDYIKLLSKLKSKTVKMICANPDEVVSKGSKLEYCAGAIAKKYEDMGGVVRYFGKPYPEVYNYALKKLKLENDFNKKKISVLVIGDNLKTDIKGANLFDIRSLLILNGIYKDFFRNNEVNFNKLKHSVNLQQLTIDYYQEKLEW